MIRKAATLMLFALLSTVLLLAQSSPVNNSNPGQSQNGQVSPVQNGQAPSGSSAVAPSAGGQLPAGTQIHATLDTPLSTRTTKPGDRFTATIAEQVSVGKESSVVIPTGARLEGEVAEAEESSKTLTGLKGMAKLNLHFRDVVLPNGETLPLSATLLSVHDTSGIVSKKSSDEAGRNAGMGIASPTAPSSEVIFGGPLKGLAIGKLSGGNYVLSTKGKDVNLPAQTGMVIRLDETVSWNGTSASIQR